MMEHNFWLILFLMFFVRVAATDVSSLNDEELKALSSSKRIEHVEVKGCVSLRDDICDEKPDGSNIVPSGTMCTIVRDGRISPKEKICNEGVWEKISLTYDVNHVIQKRSHERCTTTYSRRRRWTRRRRSRARKSCTIVNHIPRCYSYTKIKTTPSKATSVIVFWNKPVASDDEDGFLSVHQSYGVKSGAILPGTPSGQRYEAFYWAVDSKKSRVECSVTIIVKVTTCDPPQPPQHGFVSCPNGRIYGQKCQFTCSNGFTPTISEITCKYNGYWTDGGISVCQGVVCPNVPPSIPNGYYVCGDNTYGSTCDPVCNPGYNVSVQNPITCSSSGQWEGIPTGVTVCKDSDPPILINCPNDIIETADIGQTSAVVTWNIPTATDNQDIVAPEILQAFGSISPGSTVESGSSHEVRYQAFDMAGNPSLECHFTVTVDVIQCGPLDVPDNSQYSCDTGFIYGSQCTYTCYHGYTLQGTENVTCGQHGAWSSSAPSCTAITCNAPEQYGDIVENGHYECEHVSPIPYQSSCEVICDDGFRLVEYVTAICSVDDNNNPYFDISSQPECLDNESPTFPTCGVNNILSFDAIKGTRSAYVHYTMPMAVDNYDTTPIVTKLNGPEIGDTIYADRLTSLEFQAMDDAGNPPSLCIYTLQVDVIECPVYIPPSHGTIVCTEDYIYGSVCTLSCKDGYRVKDIDQTECLQDGGWSITNLECTENVCLEAPVPPENGIYQCYDLNFTFNSICQVQCNDGFTLYPQFTYTRCAANQNWETFSTPECRDTTPPYFSNCLNEITVYADKGLQSTNVFWALPEAVDNVDSEPVVTQLSGPSNGSQIVDDVSVRYQAVDAAGNPSEICTLDITIEVIQCPSPDWPYYADISCDLGTIYGSTCTYSCEEGFEVSTPSSTECLQSGIWSYGISPPTCSKITCGPPPDTVKGVFTCLDGSYEYESQCILFCESGFSVDGLVSAVCEADGQWLVTSSNQCIDIVPPTLSNCITYQRFTIERGEYTATPMWKVPTAKDNVDSADNITILQVSGPAIGSEFLAGQSVVEYTAIDSANNQAIRSCSIIIDVEEVVCLDPKYSFTDNNLVFSCPSFLWGENCTVSCPTPSSYSLTGADIITCEKSYWSYIGNVEPSCQADVCPKNLEPPLNGSLAYENDIQPVAFVMCNGAFDLEASFNGLILCSSTTGEWSHEVPDCIRAKHPRLSLLPMEFYYEGDCNDPATQEVIKAKVTLLLLEQFNATAYELDCALDNTCGYNSITVDCGATSRRKRQDSDAHSIQKKQVLETRVAIVLYNIGSVATFDDLLLYEANLIHIYDILNDRFINNEFDIPEYPTVSYSMVREEYSVIECEEPGTILDGFSCKGCSRGRYLSENDVCVKCPVGTYMDEDGALECKPCPNGTSTIQTGTKLLQKCLEYCPVGFVSQSGFKPCTPCQTGFYQDSVGQQLCLPCATGQTTIATGQENCTEYDVVFNGASTEDIYTTIADSNVISIAFWILKDCLTQVKVTLTNTVQLVAVEIDSMISVNDIPVYDFAPFCTKWTHVILIIKNTDWSLYINGTSVMSVTEPLFTTIPNNSKTRLQYESGDSELRINSFGLFTKELSTLEISDYQSSCINDYVDAVLTSDDIIHRYSGIDTDQSTCIASDSCKDEPCGDHICTPTNTGYICICLNGYTGTTCDIAPDFCYQNDCQNDATCINNVNNYTCLCSSGYRGKFCQISPVRGGWGTWSAWSSCTASCDNGVRSRTRQCDNPTPGQYDIPCDGLDTEEENCNTVSCETQFPCSVNPCGDNACVETGTGYQCICNSGYTGLQCDSMVDKCDPNPCYNDATCTVLNEDIHCACSAGFEGTFCENVIDDKSYWTEWSLCNVTCGGGISNRTFVCPINDVCDTIYQEKICNDEPCRVDHCDSNPCVNGTCISNSEGFTCICAQTHKGVLCNEPVNYCDFNPCKHGLCVPTESTFTCNCSNTGYTGLYCSQPAAVANWSPWSEWTSCSVSCGTGVRERTRLCNNPSPPLGGEMCPGENVQNIQCSSECNDICSTNPCGEEHKCRTDGDSYICICQLGYTGNHCEVSPDPCSNHPCKNNGECVQNNDKPLCNCVNGYSGNTCGIPPDESSWSPWSDWTDCSASCDTGTRSRARDCKVGSLGQDCIGKGVDTGNCRIKTCPSCPRFWEKPGMKKECNYAGETKQCTVRCKDGYFPPKYTYEDWNTTYYCGPSNGYTWNTSDTLNECSRGIVPQVLSTSVPMQVTPLVPCSQSNILISSLYEKISNLACRSILECTISVLMPACGSRVRKSTDSLLEVNFEFNMSSIEVTNDTIDVWGVVNETLLPFTDDIDSWSSITIDNITYIIDPNDYVNTTDVIQCPTGFFLQDHYGVCAGCSSGTMYDIDTQQCIYCPIGSYQENTGQLSCDSCPDGYTTLRSGSNDRNDCIESTEEDGTAWTGIVIGTVIGVLCFIVLSVIIGYVVYKKKNENKVTVLAQETPPNNKWAITTGHGYRPESSASISNVKVAL